MTDPHLAPHWESSALVTIDMQRDVLSGRPHGLAGTTESLRRRPPERLHSGGRLCQPQFEYRSHLSQRQGEAHPALRGTRFGVVQPQLLYGAEPAARP